VQHRQRVHDAETAPSDPAQYSRNRDEHTWTHAIDDPALTWLHPGLKQNEQRERPLNVRQLPARRLLHRIDEQRPRVLKVRDHDHRDERGAELNPAVVHAHRSPPEPAPARRRSSRSFAPAYTARVDGIGTPSRSPSSTTAPTTASISSG